MGTGGDNNGPGAPIGWMSMKNMGSKVRVRSTKEKNAVRNTQSSASGDPDALTEVTSNDGLLSEEDGGREAGRGVEGGAAVNGEAAPGAGTFQVYKRRWFGLFQLALLNIIVSWDVSYIIALLCTRHPPRQLPALHVLCG
jgi:hypothetical protein